jgi:hypothetical protein
MRFSAWARSRLPSYSARPEMTPMMPPPWVRVPGAILSRASMSARDETPPDAMTGIETLHASCAVLVTFTP